MMYQKTTLDNGLRIVTAGMPHARSVSVLVVIGVGSRHEPDDLAGLFHFIEHMPFKGTRKWPSPLALSKEIEGVGGEINAETDRDTTIFWAKMTSMHTDRAVAVILDMILHPLIKDDDVEKEREVIINEINENNDHPDHICSTLVNSMIWPHQPMGRYPGGSVETILSIDIDDIHQHWEDQYRPNNTVISVAGAVDHGDIVQMVRNITKQWEPKTIPTRWPTIACGHDHPPVILNDHDTNDTYIRVGLPGISLNDPDRYAATVFNLILGEGTNSRLFQNLREDLGLAYDCGSDMGCYSDCGMLLIGCETNPSHATESIAAIRKELEGLLIIPSQSEVYDAKEYVRGQMWMEMEDSLKMAGRLAFSEAWTGKITTPEYVIASIDKVTPNDVLRVAERLIRYDRLRLAVVGPHEDTEIFKSTMGL